MWKKTVFIARSPNATIELIKSVFQKFPYSQTR